MSRRTPHTVHGDEFITENIARGSTVVTDAWNGYQGLEALGYRHYRRSRRAARAAGDDPNELLPGVHRVASLLKRWLPGTRQGSVEPAHLPAYLDEFVYAVQPPPLAQPRAAAQNPARADSDAAAGTAPREGSPASSAPGPPAQASSAQGSLAFPQVARLALDELLEELIVRAGEVKATQGRLRGLLAATHRIAAGLELAELLPRIVESACTLVGARYGALGVLGDGRFVEFVKSGMTSEQIATLTAGQGVLGRLIEHPEPLRLDDLSRHLAAAGFPAVHPPMASFLGVPVMVGGTVHGHLLLAEAEAGRFGVDDEELVVALAAASGMAIENAQLYHEARRRERWQAVSTQITRDLLPATPMTAMTWSPGSPRGPSQRGIGCSTSRSRLPKPTAARSARPTPPSPRPSTCSLR